IQDIVVLQKLSLTTPEFHNQLRLNIMQNPSIVLAENDVISLESVKITNLSCTFKVDELSQALQSRWARNEDEKLATSEGLDCQVLRPNGEGWQTGKFRIVVEFCPDLLEEETDEVAIETPNTDSPLDALRQETAQSNGHD
ncbi:MAG: KGK domain-containing protein, partial [Thermosynechococcaceae cyanobacterium]